MTVEKWCERRDADANALSNTKHVWEPSKQRNRTTSANRTKRGPIPFPAMNKRAKREAGEKRKRRRKQQNRNTAATNCRKAEKQEKLKKAAQLRGACLNWNCTCCGADGSSNRTTRGVCASVPVTPSGRLGLKIDLMNCIYCWLRLQRTAHTKGV